MATFISFTCPGLKTLFSCCLDMRVCRQSPVTYCMSMFLPHIIAFDCRRVAAFLLETAPALDVLCSNEVVKGCRTHLRCSWRVVSYLRNACHGATGAG